MPTIHAHPQLARASHFLDLCLTKIPDLLVPSMFSSQQVLMFTEPWPAQQQKLGLDCFASAYGLWNPHYTIICRAAGLVIPAYAPLNSQISRLHTSNQQEVHRSAMIDPSVPEAVKYLKFDASILVNKVGVGIEVERIVYSEILNSQHMRGLERLQPRTREIVVDNVGLDREDEYGIFVVVVDVLLPQF